MIELSENLRKLLKNPTSCLGFLIVMFFAFLAVFAPFIAPPEYPDEPYLLPKAGWALEPSPPSPEHPFGTTEGQYDIFYGVVWGSRTAFKVGFITVFFSALIGIVIGSISGYFGGWIDEIIMRITDIFMAFPFLVSAMVLTTILGKGLDKVMIALIVFGWMGYARLIRGSFLSEREELYVLAAKAVGVSTFRVIFKHILPNTIYPVVIQASMSMGSMVVTASALSFLGVGAPDGYADWGGMISYARNWIVGAPGEALKYWYTFVYPGGAIALFVLGWNLLGDAIRDILDPKLRRIKVR